MKILNLKLLVLTFLFVLFFNFELFSQREGANWHFGSNVGLNFGVDNQVEVIKSLISTREGCSSISDKKGNLLFYTDGTFVYDRNHRVMPNGYDLNGNSTSTQSAMIARLPQSENVYYIFTTDSNYRVGAAYSIVDMNLNSGYGDVFDKNITLFKNSTEKLAATFHKNLEDIWIVYHEWGNNRFRSYLLTKNGLTSTPIYSDVGIPHLPYYSITDAKIGQMKINPQGNKLGTVKYYNSDVELFDFNNQTGVVSNGINLTPLINQGPIDFSNPNLLFSYPYGCEFSPNGEMFYFTSNRMYQIDIKKITGNEKNMKLWTKEVKGLHNIGALQLAIDGKLYKAFEGQNIINGKYYSLLSGINKPDEIIDENVIDTCVIMISNENWRTVRLGLPNFISSYFNPELWKKPDVTKINTEISLIDTICKVGYTDNCLPIYLKCDIKEGEFINENFKLFLKIKYNKSVFNLYDKSTLKDYNIKILNKYMLNNDEIVELEISNIKLNRTFDSLIIGRLCGDVIFGEITKTTIEILEYDWKLNNEKVEVYTEIENGSLIREDVCLENLRKITYFEYPTLNIYEEGNTIKLQLKSVEVGNFYINIYDYLGNKLFNKEINNISGNIFNITFNLNEILEFEKQSLVLLNVLTPNINITKKIMFKE